MKNALKKRLGVILCGIILLGSLSMINPVPASAAGGSATIDPATASFDKKAGNQADITTTITLNDATEVIDVKKDGTSIGTENYNYSVTEAVYQLTVSKVYLDLQAVGSLPLEIDFDAGDPAILMVEITDTTPPPSISPTTAYFNKYIEKRKDVSTTISWNSAASVDDILADESSIGLENYSIKDDVLTIKKEYLAAKGTGSLELTVVFDNDSQAELNVVIVDIEFDPQYNANARKIVNNCVTNAISANFTGSEGFMWVQGNKYYDIAVLLEEALEYEPYRVDILHNLASAYMLGDFMLFTNFDKIIETYERITELSPNDANALYLLAFWKHFAMDKTEYGSGSIEDPEIASIIEKLEKADASRAAKITDLLTGIEEVLDTPVVGMLTLDEIKAYRQGKHVGILALGNALNPDGTMSDTLKMRLEETLKAATLLPASKIFVTGGVPKNGNSEAILMKNWLIENGIDESRIFDENHSTSTINNMVYSQPLLEREGIDDLILISSATHVRRGAVIMKAVEVTFGSTFPIKTFAYMDKTTEELVTEQGSISMIYGNAARALNENCINLIVPSKDTIDYDPDNKDIVQWSY